ncbi:MAG: hypothetical protein KAG96_02020 [Ichthyobacteriaceae bacterium]|nr:hypothetical protein [Ichthyobacteriaceae bacterium]
MIELLTEEYFVLFFIMAIGIAIGKIKIKGIGLDQSAVIFVAMIIGMIYDRFGIQFQFSEVINKFGLVLFIYTIGMQAGPSFFKSFKAYGYQTFILITGMLVMAAIVSVSLVSFFDLHKGMAVGLFTGAITSASGLAAASEVSTSPYVKIGYGIAFPVGIITIIAFVKMSVKLFGVNIKDEEEKYKLDIEDQNYSIVNRHFSVTNENVDGKTLKEIGLRTITHCTLARIMRANGDLIIPCDTAILYTGDIVKVVGKSTDLEMVSMIIGHETTKKIPSYKNFESKWYVITNSRIVSRSLREIDLMQNYTATITRIRRAGIDITPYADFKFRYGDKIMISSPKENARAFSQIFGNKLSKLSETSFLPVAIGIILGVLLGTISFPFLGLNIKLGLTGGVLVISILMSYKGKTGPIIWNLNASANQLLRQLGLLLFLIPIGLELGSQIIDTFLLYGFKLFVVSFFITLIPLVVTTIIGKYVLKMNFLVLLGVITGGMNSTPGLTVAETMTETETPQMAYASVYPFGLVLIIVVSQILGMIMG